MHWAWCALHFFETPLQDTCKAAIKHAGRLCSTADDCISSLHHAKCWNQLRILLVPCSDLPVYFAVVLFPILIAFANHSWSWNLNKFGQPVHFHLILQFTCLMSHSSSIFAEMVPEMPKEACITWSCR